MIVDDASTDGAAAVLAAISDGRVRVLWWSNHRRAPMFALLLVGAGFVLLVTLVTTGSGCRSTRRTTWRG